MKKANKKYQKPQLTRVKLVAEEAVLTGCANKDSTGPSTPNCSCSWMTCSTGGS